MPCPGAIPDVRHPVLSPLVEVWLQKEPTKFDYSIIVPVYFNEGSLWPTFKSIQAEVFARNPDLNGEVVFIDDGSGDGSFSQLMEIYQANPDRVQVIKLTRNFGQAGAILAGFVYARSQCWISISADGQDPITLIHEMITAMSSGGTGKRRTSCRDRSSGPGSRRSS